MRERGSGGSRSEREQRERSPQEEKASAGSGGSRSEPERHPAEAAEEAAEADDAVELDREREGGPSLAEEDDVQGQVPLPDDDKEREA
jgi:hypothetical protein